MESRIILGSDSNFTRAEESLKWLWEHRTQGELHEIEIKPYKSKRSNTANAYWWAAIVTPLAKHLGYTPDECHEVLLSEIYGTKEVEFKGKKREVPRRRSHDMNTAEFAELIEHGTRIAAELGVYVEPWSNHQ